MSLPLVSDVMTATRALMSDVGAAGAGECYTDAILLPFVARGYRYAGRYLRAKGVGIVRKQSAAIAVTSGQTTLTRSPGAAPNFPADMLRPIEVRERPTGGAVGTYKTMRVNDGFFPDQALGTELKIWDWRLDQLITPGSTTSSIDVQIQYEADLPALTTVGDSILIPDSIDALANLAAACAAASRDEQANATALQTMGERDLDLLAASELLIRKAQGARWGGQ